MESAESLTLDGRRLAWRRIGGGDPLLLVNGYAATAVDWDPTFLAGLAERFEVICPDNRGLGDSELGDTAAEPLTADSMAADLEAVLDAIGIGGLPVVGWSMGGFVAQRLAIEHPGRVTRLVLAGTNPGGRRAVLGSTAEQEVDSDPDPSTAAILRELYPPHRQREGRRFLRRLVRASQSGEIPDDFHVAARTTRRQVAAEDPWLRSDRNYRQLGALRIPLLATAGADDHVVPPLNLRRIADRVPQGRLRVFAGAHAFLFQQRRAFTKVVDHFLRTG